MNDDTPDIRIASIAGGTSHEPHPGGEDKPAKKKRGTGGAKPAGHKPAGDKSVGHKSVDDKSAGNKAAGNKAAAKSAGKSAVTS